MNGIFDGTNFVLKLVFSNTNKLGIIFQLAYFWWHVHFQFLILI